MSTLVVVPTYNEAGNIEPLTRQLAAQPVDVLIVDDNSPDGTGEIADRLSRERSLYGRVHVLHRMTKDGLGRAYLAGFRWAIDAGYDLMVEMDADFSHDPIYLPKLLEAAQENDVVIGSRYLNGISVINWPLRRILLSWGANQYVQRMTGLPINDCTSGYRVYRRRVLQAIDLDSVRSNGYSFQVEMTFRAHLAGFRIAESPIIFMERQTGASKMDWKVIGESIQMPLRLRLGARALRRQMRPALTLVETMPDREIKKAA